MLSLSLLTNYYSFHSQYPQWLYSYIYTNDLDKSTINRIIGLCFIFLFSVKILIDIIHYYTNTKVNSSKDPKKNDDHHSSASDLTAFEPRWYQLLFVVIGGVCAGFITIVANVAGPIITMIMTTVLAFTQNEIHANRAYLFLALNLVKVPFHVSQGNLHMNNMGTCITAIVITLISTKLTQLYIQPFFQNKKALFENASWFLVFLIAINLVFYQTNHHSPSLSK